MGSTLLCIECPLGFCQDRARSQPLTHHRGDQHRSKACIRFLTLEHDTKRDLQSLFTKHNAVKKTYLPVLNDNSGHWQKRIY